MSNGQGGGGGNGGVYAILIIIVILILAAVLYMSGAFGGGADDATDINADVNIENPVGDGGGGAAETSNGNGRSIETSGGGIEVLPPLLFQATGASTGELTRGESVSNAVFSSMPGSSGTR